MEMCDGDNGFKGMDAMRGMMQPKELASEF